MQGTESSQFLPSHFPTSPLHNLPNGHIPYLGLSMPSSLHSQGYDSSLAVTERQYVGKQREKWAKVVLVTGLVMLVVAWLGLAGHVLILRKTIHKRRWAAWGIGVGMCGMIIVVGLLAIRAGVKKTSSAALLYLRLLVLFTLLFVIAFVLSSMLRLKTETHKWKHQKSNSFQTISPSTAFFQPNSQTMDLSYNDRRDKDDKDEWKKEKKAAKEAYLIGMFTLVFAIMGIFAGCVLCAIRLLKATREYEHLYETYDQMTTFPYIQMATVPTAPQRIRYPQVN